MDGNTRDLERAALEAPGDATAASKLAVALAREGKAPRYLPPIHTSAETALVQAGYPYGFRGKCLRRVWVETKPKHGQRLMTQTSVPYYPTAAGELVAPDASRTRWNKPKGSTYRQCLVIYLDDAGHVQQDGAGLYDDAAKLDAFEARAAVAIGETERMWLAVLRARIRALSRLTWSVHEPKEGERVQTLDEQGRIISALTANERAEARGEPIPFPCLGTKAAPAPVPPAPRGWDSTATPPAREERAS